MHFGNATPTQQARCWEELQRLGFRQQRSSVKMPPPSSGLAGDPMPVACRLSCSGLPSGLWRGPRPLGCKLLISRAPHAEIPKTAGYHCVLRPCRQRVLKVKSQAEANQAAGGLRRPGADQASAGTFVAAEKRVHGDPRTLYGRGGGIFGLAKLADRLMDSWMNNAALNANAKVAKWTESGQRQGFKFLVTQVMGYLCGGPQRYTGQPMEAAHKHLAITPQQWDEFMRDAALTMGALRIDAPTQAELGAMFTTFRAQVCERPTGIAPAGRSPGSCTRSATAALSLQYPRSPRPATPSSRDAAGHPRAGREGARRPGAVPQEARGRLDVRAGGRRLPTRAVCRRARRLGAQ